MKFVLRCETSAAEVSNQRPTIGLILRRCLPYFYDAVVQKKIMTRRFYEVYIFARAFCEVQVRCTYVYLNGTDDNDVAMLNYE